MQALKQQEFLGHVRRNYDTGEGLSVIETVYHTHVYQGVHAHENSHLTFFLQGGTFEKRKHIAYDVKPGQLLFYHSGESHQNLNTQFPSKNINLNISSGFLQAQGVTESKLAAALNANPRCRALLLLMYQETFAPDAFSRDTVLMLLQQLLGRQLKAVLRDTKPRWAEILDQFLQDHWQDTPALAELAQVCGVHPVTISKHFPRYFRCTLGTYIRSIKVNRALLLLMQTRCSLSEIAFTCGFADQSHFVRVFKEQTGYLPTALRKF